MKYFVFILGLLLSSTSFTQTVFEFDEDTIVAGFGITYASHSGDLINESGAQQTVNVSYSEVQMPVGWNFSFCVDLNCFVPSTTSHSFQLADGDTAVLKGVWGPSGSGIGVVEFKVATSDSPDTLKTFLVLEVGELGGIDIVSNVYNKVWPNPTNGIIHFSSENAQDVEQVVLFDVYGKKQETSWSKNDQQIDIALNDLPPGNYYLKLIKTDGEVEPAWIILE